MKQKIILEFDSYYPDKLYDWFLENKFNQTHDVYILTKPKKNSILKNKLSCFKGINYITYLDIFTYESNATPQIKLYCDFVKFYTNDHITARFIDRAGYNPEYGIGVQNAFTHQTFKSYNMLMFLIDHKFDYICFRNTPHDSEEWLLAKCTEFLKIDIYTLEDYIFPWLYTIKKGYYKERELLFYNLKTISKSELKKHIQNFVTKVSGNYEDAIPTYEKTRLGKGIFRFYNPFKLIKQNFKNPYRFINKTKNFIYYRKHSKDIKLESLDYFVFFLHFQPERSTLPDGFDFVDQFYTIRLLSLILPKGVTLLVKEHPSMFTRYSHPKFRNITNYQSIQKLENVVLVTINTESFKLIDHAKAVITIKGTVALEAYIRKKPVITFGKSNLSLYGAHNFRTLENLEKFIGQVLNGEICIDNVVNELTQSCYNVSVSGLAYKPEDMIDYSFNKDIREKASITLLTYLLKLHSKNKLQKTSKSKFS